LHTHHHHAKREEAEQQRLDSESRERQHVGWVIDAARTVAVRVSDAVEETVQDEDEGVATGERGVEDE